MAAKKTAAKRNPQSMHSIEKGCRFPSDRPWNSLPCATAIYNGLLVDEKGERGF